MNCVSTVSVVSGIAPKPESCNSVSNATALQKVAESPAPSVRPNRRELPRPPEVRKANLSPDLSSVHWLWRETDQRLDSLTKSVREGRGVAEASNFARWLQFSGLLKILKPFECERPLPVRVAALTLKMEQLISECNEWYALHERSNKPRDAYISQSKLDSIDERLAAIEAKLSTAAEVAPLRVINGGNNA
ncbi:MAG TPA: hypothetical protein VK327_14760 [Candidatus Paceibacterota bacterium]|nr:hypothetical protein [Candidatus Paceibacterota bacterium]